MKKIICCLFILAYLLSSCSDDSKYPISKDEKVKIKLSYEEFISINDDLNSPLTTEEVLNLVTEFENGITSSKSKSSNANSIKSKYYIEISENSKLKSRNSVDEDVIEVYEVNLKDTNTEGFALISADRRVSGIIAYIPNGSLADTIDNKALAQMLKLSEATYIQSVHGYNHLIDSLKEKTIDKICQSENISRDEYYKNGYIIKYTTDINLIDNNTTHTKAARLPEPGAIKTQIGPHLKTQWDQWAPYNNQVPHFCPGGGRAPTGCVATALAQIAAYYKRQPKDNSYYYNYDAMLKYTKIPYTDQVASNYVSKLMVDIGIGVDMNYACGGSGAYSVDAVNYFSKKFGLSYSLHIGRELVPSDMYNILRQGRIIYISGTSSSGAHAWLVDGSYGTSYVMSYLKDFYVHCNFGWGGSSDGYFCIYQYHKTSGQKYINIINNYIVARYWGI